MRTTAILGLTAGSLVLLLGGAQGVVTPQGRCAGTKTKAAGTKANGKLACDGNAAIRGASPDPSCLQRQTDKFDRSFQSAESKPPCATTGDRDAIESKVDAFVSDVRGELSTTTSADPCAGAKMKAAGKKAQGKLNCKAKALLSGRAFDPSCLSRATEKFDRAWSSAESRGGCHTTGDRDTIENKVDAFVTDVMNELPASTTTSTTTTTVAATTVTTSTATTTVTTTTVRPPVCGNGVVEPGESCDPPGSLTCPPTSPGGAFTECQPGCLCPGQTTTTTVSTTTTTTLQACCSPNVTTSQSTGHCSNNASLTCFRGSDCGSGNSCTTDGSLTVDGLPPFAFPLGVVTTIEIGAGDAGCKHPAVVPAGGFSVPHFDIPTLNFCSKVETVGCESGAGVGGGSVWDGHSACSDADVIKNGDTSAPPCATLGSGCNTNAGGAGADTLADIDSVIGDGNCDPAGVNTELDIPVLSTTWSDSTCSPFTNPGCCASSEYNPAEGDSLITQFGFLLSPTSAKGEARWHDKNADGCAKAGNGPTGTCINGSNNGTSCQSNAQCTGGGTCDGYVTLTGSPAPGPCCVVGQKTTVVSVGLAPSGGGPLYDLTFQSTIPTQITSCTGTSTGASCVVTTNMCAR